ncbi:MAG: hypothetical protein RBS56_04095 [Candidatus Gracilibacteria bacterium]|jgi:hypothetical protein|nr:hypothetical protein [Candidatus Gracilibacteria bacterium]
MENEKINKTLSFFLGNKALLFAAFVAIIGVVFGLISLFSLSSTSQYQGLIKQVENTTQTMSQK